MGTICRFFRFALPIALLLTAAIFVPLKVLDHRGLPRVRRLDRELEAIEEINEELRRENEELRLEIQAFHTDPDYVERVARDELGMVGPGEVIYQFPNDK